jgi:hypothetical protein
VSCNVSMRSGQHLVAVVGCIRDCEERPVPPDAARVLVANRYCERLLGSLRRERLGFPIPFGEEHLRRTLRARHVIRTAVALMSARVPDSQRGRPADRLPRLSVMIFSKTCGSWRDRFSADSAMGEASRASPNGGVRMTGVPYKTRSNSSGCFGACSLSEFRCISWYSTVPFKITAAHAMCCHVGRGRVYEWLPGQDSNLQPSG